ncbi:hypothetical protein [Actinokineospora sp. UTMC 2448]|uniref:hypothetical protein n=1 Tax=Actinokineospora sp. UTMC 2448 TaxID=2268449 RepID=UPI002164E8C0|nr:hypothetical protein [Actinokineospora sp. UTMC 2448]UVS78405.1 hypothetical protein Actkin_02138 [Actinokineospora sp. UTMC 2448]
MTADAGTNTPESFDEHRALSKLWFDEVMAIYDVAEAPAAEDSPSRPAEIASAQLAALRALYHEMRCGHELLAAQLAAVDKQTKALREVAFQLEKVASHLGDR